MRILPPHCTEKEPKQMRILPPHQSEIQPRQMGILPPHYTEIQPSQIGILHPHHTKLQPRQVGILHRHRTDIQPWQMGSYPTTVCTKTQPRPIWTLPPQYTEIHISPCCTTPQDLPPHCAILHPITVRHFTIG